MSSRYNFKKEEEVKQFIKNLGIEYRFGCYKENKPEVCHLLGDYLETIDKDVEKAYDIFKMNCDENNHGQSCGKYGSHLVKGEKIEDLSLLKLANEYMSKGCELGHIDTCCTAGQTGIKLIQETDKAAPLSAYSKYTEMLDRSCQQDNETACFALGSFYLEMLSFKAAHDPLKKSCELENPYACANLSIMYKKGEGVEANKELESKYRSIAMEIWRDYTKEKDRIAFQQGLPPV